MIKMSENNDRRIEQRLRYHWPIWFAEDFEENLLQGQMVDVSSGGAAFTCHANEDCPYPGQSLTARFSVPHFVGDGAFDMASFTRIGKVCRVDKVNSFLSKVAVQFAERLPFQPGQQAEEGSEVESKLKSVTI